MPAVGLPVAGVPTTRDPRHGHRLYCTATGGRGSARSPGCRSPGTTRSGVQTAGTRGAFRTPEGHEGRNWANRADTIDVDPWAASHWLAMPSWSTNPDTSGARPSSSAHAAANGAGSTSSP